MKLIVFKEETYFLISNSLLFFVDLFDFIYFRNRVLVVSNVCCSIFMIVHSIAIINNAHGPSRLAFLYSIGCLWNDICF